MKYVRMVGLCLMAAFALGAIAASSASAASGLLLAQVAGGGSIAGVSFLSLGLLALLTTHAGLLIHCEHFHDHGLFLSSTLGHLLVLFLHCTTKAGTITVECNSEGTPAGEIHLPLGTTLFHLGLAHLTLSVGNLPAAVILLDKDVKLECAGGLAKVLVLGAVIGALQLDLVHNSHFQTPLPLNTPVESLILNFQQTAHGLQHLRLFLFEHELYTYDLHSFVTEGGVESVLLLSAEVALALLDLFLLPTNPPKHVAIELVEHP